MQHKYILIVKEKNVSDERRAIKMKEEWKELLKETFIKYKYTT
ncbi:hypothetical protein [Pseudogracilibacillus sp. ICA-222130]